MQENNKKYKPSKYNFFFDTEDGTHLAFNAISGGFVKISEQNYGKVKKLMSSKNYIIIREDEPLINSLIKGRFLIEEIINEIDLIKTRNLIGRFPNNLFDLTISPTSSCNLKCPYCYVVGKNYKIVMSNDVISRIYIFVNKMISNVDVFNVCWTGGELLLYYNKIKSMSKKFKEISNDKCTYKASLVTNGVLMKKEIVNQFSELNIKSVQITLDGPPEIHNKRRILKNGDETFKIILDNLKYLSENKNHINVILRINVDKENVNDIEELLYILEKEGLKKRVQIGISKVYSFAQGCSHYDHSCLGDDNFSIFKLKLASKLVSKGFDIYFLPKPISHVCGANVISSYVIDPIGRLYKCWDHIGIKEESIGYIKEDGNLFINPYKLSSWISRDPFEIKECLECKILPLCMGGCLLRRRNKGKGCPDWKNYINEILKIKWNILKNSSGL